MLQISAKNQGRQETNEEEKWQQSLEQMCPGDGQR